MPILGGSRSSFLRWLSYSLCCVLLLGGKNAEAQAPEQPLFLPNAPREVLAGSLRTVYTISLRSQPSYCLDLRGGDTRNGNAVEIWPCNGVENQLWYFDPGSWNLKYGGDSRKCIDAGSSAQGSALQIWDCNGLPQQRLGYDATRGTIYLAGAGEAAFEANSSHKRQRHEVSERVGAKYCFDVAAGKLAPGTLVQVWGCNGMWQQQWNLIPGYSIRVNEDNDLCLDAAGASDGAVVQVWRCNGHPNQYWIFDEQTWAFRSGADLSKCLDAGDSSEGRGLQLWTCNALPQQRWGYDARLSTLYLATSLRKNAAKCADVAGGSLKDGSRVQVWSCSGCWNQRFRITGPASSRAESTFSKFAPSTSTNSGACPVAPYEQDRALLFKELAWAAYSTTEQLTSWNCPHCIGGVTRVQVCQGTTTKSFVALWEDQCLVSFEGTHQLEAWLRDLEVWQTSASWPACGSCQVHSGFLDEWHSMQACIVQQLQSLGCPNKYLRTTGHSLGAGINALAMMELSDKGWVVTESYDFGMPRTGNDAFAKAFTSRFGDRSFRVTHREDPVVQVPPEPTFAHKEPEVFYPGSLGNGYIVCNVADDTACSHKYWNLVVDMMNVQDHQHYLENNAVETANHSYQSPWKLYAYV